MTAPAEAPAAAEAVEAPNPADAQDVFTIEDLETIPHLFSWETLPDGRKVCIQPLSVDSCIAVNSRVFNELHLAGLKKSWLTGEAAEVQSQHETLQAILRGRFWVFVYACRTGEAWHSPRVFSDKDAEDLKQRPGWQEAVERLAGLAEELGRYTTAEGRRAAALALFLAWLSEVKVSAVARKQLNAGIGAFCGGPEAFAAFLAGKG